MAECKMCGEWFSSSSPKDVVFCIACNRTLERLKDYVAPIVRCKDCIYSHRDNDYRFGYVCEKPLYHPQMGESRQRKLMQDIDFCSYGKRKDK